MNDVADREDFAVWTRQPSILHLEVGPLGNHSGLQSISWASRCCQNRHAGSGFLVDFHTTSTIPPGGCRPHQGLTCEERDPTIAIQHVRSGTDDASEWCSSERSTPPVYYLRSALPLAPAHRFSRHLLLLIATSGSSFAYCETDVHDVPPHTLQT